MFPGIVDTSSSVPPNYYVTIIDGTQRLGLRNRTMLIAGHLISFDNNKQSIKLLAEYHHLADASAGDTASDLTILPPAVGYWALNILPLLKLE